MSLDALLWICTLLFAAAMLILSAMRHAEATGAADDADADEGETRQAY
jgi:high-affinity Fe2+/Pb2+ permease